MNIQGSNIVERRSVRNSDASRHRIALVFQVAILVVCAAFMANTYIYFNQKITEADRTILRLKAELANVEREIDSYRLQYEKYSAWPHIREAIRRFNLPLRPALPEQNRKLAMIPPALAPRIAITFRETTHVPAVQQVSKPAAIRRQASSAPVRHHTVPKSQSRYPDFRYSRN